jgi:hypothetical protein
MDDVFWTSITKRADAALSNYLASGLDDHAADHRAIMHRIKAAVTCHLNPGSSWHGSAEALATVTGWVTAMLKLQAPDGLFGSDGNLASPPDSSFTINDAAMVYALLQAHQDDRLLDELSASLAVVLRAAAPALERGGVHTPNHRLGMAAALCRVQAVMPGVDLRQRIEAWLGEGVDIDADGLYSERSPSYASQVSNPCLLVVGELLGRPDLIELVHRNLHAQIDLADPNGVVETVLSRRQDQNDDFYLGPFLMQFRRFGLAGCTDCASMARAALKAPGVDAVGTLAELLGAPELGAELPPSAPIDYPQRRLFAEVRLMRDRRGRAITTVYGGSDIPVTGRLGSGLACNPTFLRWRWGGVSLHSVRLSREFFGLGPFRSQGLEIRGQGARLSEHITAWYYQPLPAERRRADGRYELQHEGRFAASLSFSERDRDLVELTTEILITPRQDALELTAEFAGVATSYAFELCFRPGGEFGGVEQVGPDSYLLAEGEGSYRVGEDVIVFGPGGGSGPQQPARYGPGEAYTFLNGTDALTWPRAYITGRTPGITQITLRGQGGRDLPVTRHPPDLETPTERAEV